MYNRMRIDPIEKLTNTSPEVASLLAKTLKKREALFTDHLTQRDMRKGFGQVNPNVNTQGNLLVKPQNMSLIEFRKQLTIEAAKNEMAMAMASPMASPIASPKPMPVPNPISKHTTVVSRYLPSGNLVSVKLGSGLGNWIFKILGGLGYAEKYGKQFVITKNNIHYGVKAHEQGLLDKIVRIFPNIPILDSVANPSLITEKTQFNYSPLGYCNSNVILHGYFQDEQYFPSEKLIPTIKTAYYPDTYFVHIRAGDYLKSTEFNIDLVKYYKNCFSLLDPSIKYIVFSNDNKYAETYMKQFGVSYTLSDKVDQVDALIEMANCAGGICANSSFSWLGAFFQGDTRGQVFMPSKWINGKDFSGIFPSWASIIGSSKKSLDATIGNSNTNGNVTVILSGGLGNRIFQVFAGLAYARKHNKKFVLCKSIYTAPTKPHEANTDYMIDFLFPNIEYVPSFESYSIAHEKRHMDYNELEYYNGNVLLKGYFQVGQYSEELENIPNIRTAYYENTYFIHLRLGDYIGFFGMDFDLTNYHRRCINILGPNAKYIIFSNENDKAETYIKQFNINYTISDKTDALECLIEMANCAGGICANSTFSWMGGFFQRKPRKNIFVPAKWVPIKVNGIFPSWAARIAV
jgi:hypothetical protein